MSVLLGLPALSNSNIRQSYRKGRYTSPFVWLLFYLKKDIAVYLASKCMIVYYITLLFPQFCKM